MADPDDAELEEIRRRKLQQLQGEAEAGAERADQEAVIEAQRQAVLRQVLTEDARERLGRVKVAYPDFGKQVEDQLLYLVQAGQLDKSRPVDDETLKAILERLSPKKRDINIKRR